MLFNEGNYPPRADLNARSAMCAIAAGINPFPRNSTRVRAFSNKASSGLRTGNALLKNIWIDHFARSPSTIACTPSVVAGDGNIASGNIPPSMLKPMINSDTSAFDRFFFSNRKRFRCPVHRGFEW